MATPFRIKSLAEDDRPRERALLKGIEDLSDSELIAILLRSGSTDLDAVSLARLILNDVDHNLHQLARKSIQDLCKYKGVGEAKAIAIVAAMEIGRRRWAQEFGKQFTIRTSGDAYRYIRHYLIDKTHEEFYVILLNHALNVVGREKIASGGSAHVQVEIRRALKSALHHNASRIVLAHNHPTGQLKPSTQDVVLTKRFVEAAKTLEIQVVDHIIVAGDGYYSFADENMLA